jgi:hypothetical protein
MRIIWSGFQALNDTNTDAAPTKAGVYVLWMKLAKDQWRTFYVGEADSLRFALKRHLCLTDPNRHVRRKIVNCVTGFEYSIQPDPEVRPGIIRFLDAQFKPECGSAPVPAEVEPIEVNLP